MATEQKRLFLALSLSALILFGWQYFFPQQQFAKKDFADKAVETTSTKVSETPSKVSQEAKETTPVVADSPVEMAPADVQSFTLKNDKSEVVVTNELSLSHFTRLDEERDEFTDIVGKKNPFQIYVVENGRLKALRFSLTQESDVLVSGTEPLYGISFKGQLDEKGLFNWSLNSPAPLQFFLKMESSKQEGEGRQVRQYVTLLKDTKRTNIDSDDDYEGSLQWAAVDYHYHLFANVLNKKAVSSVKIENGVLEAKLIESTKELSGYSFYGLKSYDDLQKMDNNLHLAVDFGIFGVIAVPILKGLQFFYKFAPNYGVAIILITLFIRGLLFPLQFKSFKSMKKMQKLQPELTKLKEKYSDDPQRMQKETMELFKRNGANPMGGCLPLLLQMPVFFAFYQVLFNSVELLHAPFILWIHDLSAKDPYYVLPVLMGIAMFFQTKLNPSTTADPMQKKMMMFMPLIFTFFMKDLPAGLNLYILVSTIFGVTSQLFVYKTVD